MRNERGQDIPNNLWRDKVSEEEEIRSASTQDEMLSGI